MSTDVGTSSTSPLASFQVLARPDRRVLAMVLLGGVVFDWMAQTGVDGLAGALFFVVLPLLLFFSKRLESRTSRAALCLVPLFGVWLGVRTSSALLLPDVLCALLLMGAAVMWSRGGSVFRTSMLDVASRGFTLGVHTLFVPQFLLLGMSSRSRRLLTTLPVIRGVFLAAPLIIVLGLLLMSADSVFASIFSISVDFGALPTHLFLVVIGSWLVATLLRAASCSFVETHRPRAFVGFTEAFVVVASMTALYAAFVVTQIVVWSGGARHVLETSSLTYAEHARQGFFQLVVVGAITLAVLTGLRGVVTQTSGRQLRAWRVISLSTVLLTLVIVGVAVQRLFLYEDVYGLTLLRFYATAFAFWIGAVFMLYAVSSFRHPAESRWFFGVVMVFALASVLVMNVVNPEAVVVHRNVDRIGSVSVPLDARYLGNLSDDGLMAMIPVFDQLEVAQQELFLAALCTKPYGDSGHSGLSYNRARAGVAGFRMAHCSQ